MAKTFKGIGRPHLLPQKELGYCAGILRRFQQRHKMDGVITSIIHMLKHGIHMEAVHLHDEFFQRPDNLAKLLKLFRGHLVNNKLAAVVINDLLGRIHETA